MLKTRLYFLDFIKLFFAILIALAHFGYNYPISSIGVEFFFAVSGFYLIKKFERNKNVNYSALDYVIELVKKIYFKYILAFILFFLVSSFYMLKHGEKVKSILLYLIKSIPEIFLIQNIGFFNGGINYPLWYLCILVIAGYFIYAMLKMNETVSRTFIFPLLLMLGYVFLKSAKYDMWGSVGPFHMPFIRGGSAMLLGIFYYEIYRKNWLQKLKFQDIYILISFVILLKIGMKYNVYLIFMGIIIILAQERDLFINKMFNNNIFKKCQNLSLSVFLIHGVIIKLFNENIYIYIYNGFSKKVVFIILLTIIAVIFEWLAEILSKKITIQFLLKKN